MFIRRLEEDNVSAFGQFKDLTHSAPFLSALLSLPPPQTHTRLSINPSIKGWGASNEFGL